MQHLGTECQNLVDRSEKIWAIINHRVWRGFRFFKNNKTHLRQSWLGNIRSDEWICSSVNWHWIEYRSSDTGIYCRVDVASRISCAKRSYRENKFLEYCWIIDKFALWIQNRNWVKRVRRISWKGQKIFIKSLTFSAHIIWFPDTFSVILFIFILCQFFFFIRWKSKELRDLLHL